MAAARPRRRAGGVAAAPGHQFAAGAWSRCAAPVARRPASGSRSRPATACASRATLWRPAGATGKRGGQRVPTIVYPHGGPTWQAYRSFQPFKLLLVNEGFAFLDVDFRGSTGYGRAFRHANHGEWGHADVHDLIDAGALGPRSSRGRDGRLAIYGGSYGGYMVLCALVEEPAMWSAGVDLYGDSEIAESYRHGDRVGRLDLQRQMGIARRPRVGRGLPARVAGLPRGADRGARCSSSTAARTCGSSRS